MASDTALRYDNLPELPPGRLIFDTVLHFMHSYFTSCEIPRISFI